MTETNISTFLNGIEAAIASRHIRRAFSLLLDFAADISAPWQLRNLIDNIIRNYDLMSQYALDGMSDPQRADMYHDITAQIRSLADILALNARLDTSPSLFYSTLRYERLQAERTDRIVESIVQSPSHESRRRLFNHIWTLLQPDTNQIDSLSSLFLNQKVEPGILSHLIGALLPGISPIQEAWEVILLAQVYSAHGFSSPVGRRAIILLLLWGASAPQIFGDKKVRQAMQTLEEASDWNDVIGNIFFELQQQCDTERITAKFHQAIKPVIENLRNELGDKAGAIDLQELVDPDENPQWAEIIDRTGLKKNIEELSKISAEGGDLMIATFEPLKRFGFFQTLSNWFMPFDSSHPDVITALHGHDRLAELLAKSNALCDSDKFSAAFAAGSIPQQAIESIAAKLSEANESSDEDTNSSLHPDTNRNLIDARNYIRDLYRFHTIFRAHKEFPNPFLNIYRLFDVSPFASVISTLPNLQRSAKFFFDRGYWSQATRIFTRISELEPTDPYVCQKVGYCYQRLGDIASALQWYNRSDILRPDDVWTLRHIGVCQNALGRPRKALKALSQADRLAPDHFQTILNMAEIRISLDLYNEAANDFFHAEYLKPDSTRYIRGLSRSLLHTADYERAIRYLSRLPEAELTSEDRLLHGHLLLALGRYRQSAEQYALSIALDNFNIEAFNNRLENERSFLISIIPDSTILDIVADEARRIASTRGIAL